MKVETFGQTAPFLMFQMTTSGRESMQDGFESLYTLMALGG